VLQRVRSKRLLLFGWCSGFGISRTGAMSWYVAKCPATADCKLDCPRLPAQDVTAKLEDDDAAAAAAAGLDEAAAAAAAAKTAAAAASQDLASADAEAADQVS
jgi:hypothetical protein